MIIRNTDHHYGVVAILLHWITVFIVLGLFGLGLWMSDLEYYDQWYESAPFIHKSIGITLSILTVVRLGWSLSNLKPQPLEGSLLWEQKTARIVHWLLYGSLFAVMISGYFISTAEGEGISFWGWFKIPALPWTIENHLEEQEKIVGEVHEILAFSLVTLAGLHALAALKHHFLNKDGTLLRMLGVNKINR